MDKLDDERMTDNCEERLLEIQYFVVRDYRYYFVGAGFVSLQITVSLLIFLLVNY